MPPDLPLHQGVRRGGQAIAGPGAGFYGVAVPAQAVNGLPHGRPADPQPAADLLAGKICLRLLPQQRVDLLLAHAVPSPVILPGDSIASPGRFVKFGKACLGSMRTCIHGLTCRPDGAFPPALHEIPL